MKDIEIRKLYDKLEQHYPDGGYVSRASIFLNALRDNLVTMEQVKEAKSYYGSLWNYVGD